MILNIKFHRLVDRGSVLESAPADEDTGINATVAMESKVHYGHFYSQFNGNLVLGLFTVTEITLN